MKKLFYSLLLTCLFLTGCQEVTEQPIEVDENSHIVIDSLDRQVVVPKEINRIAATYASSGHILALLDRADEIVAVNGGQKRDKLLTTLYPTILEAKNVKESGKINFEELLTTNPDIIFINRETFNDEGQIKKLEKLSIPYFVVDFNSIEELKNCILQMGIVVNNEEKARAYISYLDEKLDIISDRLKDLPESEQKWVYHSINEATRTSVKSTLSYELLETIKVKNVTSNENLKLLDNKYYASVEQILSWNPDYILVNEDGVDDYIRTQPQWKNINAVKNDHVYLLPTGLTRWAHTNSIEAPIALIYLADLLYPEYFTDIDIVQEVAYYYEQFFHIQLTTEEVEEILAGKEMRISKGAN